jgi:hypothetical protein
MRRALDDIKLGDWLTINVSGKTRMERVKSVSSMFVATDTYKFTRYGHTWPKPGGTIARPASIAEIERLRT